MLRRLTKRRVLAGLIGLAALLLALLYPAWREAGQNGGQQPAEPFRIAGNFYHVGANDVKTFLIARPGDRVVIDGGYPGTARMILESIEKLGFDVRDVREIGWAEVLRTKTSAPACGLARERSTRGPPLTPAAKGPKSAGRTASRPAARALPSLPHPDHAAAAVTWLARVALERFACVDGVRREGEALRRDVRTAMTESI
jgi:hypothetical protein